MTKSSVGKKPAVAKAGLKLEKQAKRVVKLAKRSTNIKKTTERTKKSVPKKKKVVKLDEAIKEEQAKQAQAAVNIEKVLVDPINEEPIRFPNLGDIRMGSTPIKEHMNFLTSPLVNATWNNDSVVYGIILNASVTDPVYGLASLGNAGELGWSSIGHSFLYNSLIANGALVRPNVNGYHCENVTQYLSKGGTVFYLSWQCYDGDGNITLPASVAGIIQHPQCKMFDAEKIPRKFEIVTGKEFHDQEDWHYPSLHPTTERALGQVVLFVLPNTGQTGPAKQQLRHQVTLQYEMVPEPANQPLFDTKTTMVGEDVLQEVSNVLGQAGAAGLQGSASGGGWLNRAVGIAKDVAGLAGDIYGGFKAVWDYASPYISEIAGIFGLGEEREHYKASFLAYDRAVYAFHQKFPEKLPLSLLHHVVNRFHGPVDHFSGVKQRLNHPRQKEIDSIAKFVLYYIRQDLHPLTIAKLSKHIQLIDPILYIDTTKLVAGISITNGNVLQAGSSPIATLADPNQTLRQLVWISPTVTVTSQPALVTCLSGVLYVQPLELGKKQIIFDQLTAFPIPALPKQQKYGFLEYESEDEYKNVSQE